MPRSSGKKNRSHLRYERFFLRAGGNGLRPADNILQAVGQSPAAHLEHFASRGMIAGGPLRTFASHKMIAGGPLNYFLGSLCTMKTCVK